MRRSILIIFGKNISRKYVIEKRYRPNFRPHLISASALPCKTVNAEITPFQLNVVRCFANKHTKHSEIIT